MMTLKMGLKSRLDQDHQKNNVIMEQEQVDDKHWEHLFEAYKESSTQFDKNILYISSGALGLSMTFLSDVVDLPNATCKVLLTISWVVLTLTILISLVSHYLSMKALNLEMKNLYLDVKNKMDKWVKGLNISMLVTLPLGILFLVIFISINLNSMAKKVKTKEKQGIELPKKPVSKPQVKTTKKKSST